MNEVIDTIIGVLIISAAIAFIGWMGYKIGTANKPTAMDVYQGKTTLEITYKDSVAIDSVVVFKDKKEQQ